MNKKMTRQDFYETVHKNRNKTIIFGIITLILLILVCITWLVPTQPSGKLYTEADFDGATFYFPSETLIESVLIQTNQILYTITILPFMLLFLILTIVFLIKMIRAKNKLNKIHESKQKY